MAANTSSERRSFTRKFNIIDVLILILVLLCILGIVFRAKITQWIGIEKNLEVYKLSYKIKSERYTISDYLTSGNDVYIDSSNLMLGTLDGSATFLPAEIYVTASDGTPVKGTYPKDTYVDVMGNIRCQGIEKEDGFYLNGSYAIAPGVTLKVHTMMCDFEIIVTDIVKYGA